MSSLGWTRLNLVFCVHWNIFGIHPGSVSDHAFDHRYTDEGGWAVVLLKGEQTPAGSFSAVPFPVFRARRVASTAPGCEPDCAWERRF